MIDRSRATQPRWLARMAVGASVATCGLAVFACSDRDLVMLGYGALGDSGGGSFAAPADAAVAEADVRLTSYCPSNQCPAGFTTCDNSRFPCDVDLKTDRANCGACGVACPQPPVCEFICQAVTETYECVEGHCVMQCNNTDVSVLDCDGVSDNGCETDAISNDNCGACGNKCLDPAKPCVARDPNRTDIGCGCHGGDLPCFGRCVSPEIDDRNCGACGNRCDPAGGETSLPANAYYGCAKGECGHLKCSVEYADCDGNASNGCETSVFSSENCGGCGKVCPDGQQCMADPDGRPTCMCPADLTLCPLGCFGDICFGECVDLSTSKRNCGACGSTCQLADETNSFGVCTYGMCSQTCARGRADCNGNLADSCEVNIDSDPRNCGACGTVCDAIAGQACVGGKCVVAPCEQVQEDGGGVR